MPFSSRDVSSRDGVTDTFDDVAGNILQARAGGRGDTAEVPRHRWVPRPPSATGRPMPAARRPGGPPHAAHFRAHFCFTIVPPIVPLFFVC